jgi:hypothetical protein
MKLFHLERTEDASRVSGIGKVAEGGAAVADRK